MPLFIVEGTCFAHRVWVDLWSWLLVICLLHMTSLGKLGGLCIADEVQTGFGRATIGFLKPHFLWSLEALIEARIFSYKLENILGISTGGEAISQKCLALCVKEYL